MLTVASTFFGGVSGAATAVRSSGGNAMDKNVVSGGNCLQYSRTPQGKAAAE